MGEFTGVVLGFPTVVFTGGLVVVVLFWAIVLVGAADAHGPWHHAGGAGGHGGYGGDGGHAGHGAGGRHDHVTAGDDAHDAHGSGGLLAAAGLGGVPVTVVLSLLVAVAWFLSLAGSAAVHSASGLPAAVRALLYAAVAAAALTGSWCATWILVRPLRHLFPDVRPPSREDFVGQLCVIRTGTVTARFGQAEVTATDGSTAVVQVRADGTGTGTFTAGSTALLYDYDPEGEFFRVAPFDAPGGASPDTFTT